MNNENFQRKSFSFLLNKVHSHRISKIRTHPYKHTHITWIRLVKLISFQDPTKHKRNGVLKFIWLLFHSYKNIIVIYILSFVFYSCLASFTSKCATLQRYKFAKKKSRHVSVHSEYWQGNIHSKSKFELKPIVTIQKVT